jgi:hypothetical protein
MSNTQQTLREGSKFNFFHIIFLIKLSLLLGFHLSMDSNLGPLAKQSQGVPRVSRIANLELSRFLTTANELKS